MTMKIELILFYIFLKSSVSSFYDNNRTHAPRQSFQILF